MTQDEFNAMLLAAQDTFNEMLETAIAAGLPGGYYTMKYSGEEVDALLDWVNEQTTTGG